MGLISFSSGDRLNIHFLHVYYNLWMRKSRADFEIHTFLGVIESSWLPVA